MIIYWINNQSPSLPESFQVSLLSLM